MNIEIKFNLCFMVLFLRFATFQAPNILLNRVQPSQKILTESEAANAPVWTPYATANE